MDTEQSPILIDESGAGVVTLTLNRVDKANALSQALVRSLHAAVAEHGQRARILVLRSAARAFCAGFDFSGVERASTADLLERFVEIQRLLDAVASSPALTVAFVQGAAYGAGADLVCACRVRIGDESARMRFPGFQFGLALGTRRLASIVGTVLARQVLAANLQLHAQAAHECGILTRVVPVSQWSQELRAIDESCNGLDAAALRHMHAILGASPDPRDLADLVESVLRPGLHARIAAYRARSS